MKIDVRLFVAILLLVGILFFVVEKRVGSFSRGSDLFYSESDTIKKYKDSLGREVATRKAIEGSLRELMSSTDKEIAELQKSLDKATAAISQVSVVTTDTIRDTTFMVDTISEGFPVYYFQRQTDWDTFDIRASVDSFDIKYSVVNKILISYRYEKTGFLKKRMVIEAVNENPNSSTQDLAAIFVDDNKTLNAFTVGIISFVLGIILTLILII